MENFKSKYVYPVLIIRLIFLLGLVACFFLAITIGIPSFWNKHSPVNAAGLTVLMLIVFTFLLYAFGRSVLTQRFILKIEGKVAYLQDIFTKKEILLDSTFKGYSYSSYGDSRAFHDFKTLLFYFHDGRIIEFPQFLYKNFNEIHSALSHTEVHFLGHEPYIWKNLIDRDYKFKRL
jgi:hypothetical protein